jgi:SSS family solute:Na+ symporter
MLHRGKYKIAEPQNAAPANTVGRLSAIIGMSGEFNLKDKILYLTTFGWTFSWIAIFIGGTIYNMLAEVKTAAWMTFWRYYLWLTLALSILTTVWFTVGGLIDLKKMFGLLNTMKRNELDDGTVIGHHNAAEAISAAADENPETDGPQKTTSAVFRRH